MLRRLAVLLCVAPALFGADKIYTYIGDLGPDFVLIAWGRTSSGGNSIGRESTPMGQATVRIGDQTVTADRNWALIRNLKPDTEYDYEVQLNGQRIGGGRTRTYPVQAEKVCFFVIGDWGSGRAPQLRVADEMRQEFDRRARTDCPVRFVLSTGDNIYGDVGLSFSLRGTGDSDRDWEAKFFRPYEGLLSHIPFHPTLGNHDGDESEHAADTPVYLDNFFFPNQQPSRWYSFSFANLVDFFALDSTENSDSNIHGPAYAPNGEQFRWLRERLAASKAPWKIPYFHHPIFNAGPRHGAAFPVMRHFVDAFARSGVAVVFTGHEHNFQISEQGPATLGIRFIVSGAGGELRTSDVRSRMQSANIVGWAAQVHYCIVEIDQKTMRITPRSFQNMVVRDRNGGEMQMPLTVQLP